jgi:peptide/nickel transport system ATP-binding protein/oligopeptide transport system ATP-binding protein
VSLLAVSNLHTHFVTRDLNNRLRVARALNGVSFTVEQGRIMGLVGETGAGKSLTAMSILGLLKPPARVVDGKAWFEGEDLLALPAERLNRLRGNRIALVVQSPKASLDPLARIGGQLVRLQRAHRGIGEATALARATAMLDSVGIPDAARRLRAWPHELSGGMAQRVLIAMALVNQPALLIADEPTTGLDVTVQAQILDLIRGLSRERGIGVVLITHDLGVVAHYCDTVAVMFSGQVMESGPVEAVFASPEHPYTRALLAATPERLRRGTVHQAWAPPDLFSLPQGCLYRDRCPDAATVCSNDPPWRGAEHGARCHFADGGIA